MDRSAATEQSGNMPTPSLPSIADYWPDQPGAAGSPPAEPTRTEPTRTESDRAAQTAPARAAVLAPRAATDEGITWIKAPETPPNRRARYTLGGAIALIVLVVIGAVMATLIKQAHDEPVTSAAPATPAEPSAASPAPTGAAIVVAPPAAKSASATPPAQPSGKAAVPQAPKLPAEGTFEVAASASSVTVRSANLGADLYRVTLAKAAGPVTPKITDSGANHRLTLVKAAGVAAPPITITLNAALRWSLKMSAGNTATTLNLADSKITALELAGGAHDFALRLPPVSGTLPVRVTHGMNQLTIKTNDAPVRVTLRAGAGKLVLDGDTHTDNKKGAVFASGGFATGADRVDVDAVAGLGTLTVDID